jgi:hypothetical protein
MCGLRSCNHFVVKNNKLVISETETGKQCQSIARDVMLPVIWHGRRKYWQVLEKKFNLPSKMVDRDFTKWLYEETMQTGYSNLFFVFEYLKQ